MRIWIVQIMIYIQSIGSVGSTVVVGIVVGAGVVVGGFVVVGGTGVVVGLAFDGWNVQSNSNRLNSISSTATKPVPFDFLVATNWNYK